MSDLSVILVNYNTGHLLAECLGALRAAAQGLRLQVIVVDNASRDGSADLLRRDHPDVELIANTDNLGFGRANNRALPLLQSYWVLLLNTDAFVAPDALSQSLNLLKDQPAVGIVGARLVGRDGVLQPSCRYFPTLANQFLQRIGVCHWFPAVRSVDDMAWDHASVRHCDWVPGCFYLMRREVLVQVGLFDPRYFLYMEEVDHCRAAKAKGWQVAYCPTAEVVHIGGESAKSEARISESGRQIPALQIESELLYFRKWHGLAGAALHGFLSVLAIALRVLRNLLGRRPLAWHRGQLQEASSWCTLMWRTSLGRQGTR